MHKKILTWLSSHRRHLIIGASTAVFLGVLYGYKLGSLIRGDSAYETIVHLQINGIVDVLSHVAFGPIAFGQLLMVKIDQPNSTLLRILSALVVCVAIYVFYRLISKWHTTRVALLTTFLFATSSFSLHLGRFSLKDSLYYLVIPSLLLAGTWLKSKSLVHRFRYAVPGATFFLYIPGVIYILLLLGIVFQKRLRLAWKFTDVKNRWIGAVSSFVILLPLLYGLIRYPSQIKEFFAIDRILSSWQGTVHTLWDSLTALVYNGQDEAYRWLSGTPILDVGTIVLVILGIYAFVRGPHTLRARTLVGLGLLSLILVSTGSLVSLALLLPLLYILVASGLTYLLHSWFTVFPRNPAARNTAVVLVIAFVGLISGYHLQRYFLAWPNAPATQQALQITLEKVVK